jgi:hypothetical protein
MGDSTSKSHTVDTVDAPSSLMDMPTTRCTCQAAPLGLSCGQVKRRGVWTVKGKARVEIEVDTESRPKSPSQGIITPHSAVPTSFLVHLCTCLETD